MFWRFWLHLKSQRNHVYLKLLRWVAKISERRVWVDAYASRRPPSQSGMDITVEVRYEQYRFVFGQIPGWRGTVETVIITATQRRLTTQMRYAVVEDRFYGLTESELLYLLQCKWPWLEKLPQGSADKDRPVDRRRPPHLRPRD